MKHSVKEVILKNGAKGLIVDVPDTPVVNFLVEFRAGFDLGDWQKYELPHVMEHTMFTNKAYPRPRQFSKAVEKNGAFNNAYTSDFSLEYDYECAEFEAGRIAKLIAEQISRPIFPEAELKTELGNVREELSNALSNHQAACNDNLMVRARQKPSLTERIRQLPSIKRQDLVDFYGQTHSGANMRFIISGHTNFSAHLKTLDVKLAKGQRVALPELRLQNVDAAVLESRSIDQIYYTMFSQLNSKLTYRELVAARTVVSLLVDGFSSSLFGLAREKGLIYGVNMGVNPTNYDTNWRMAGFVTPANATKFFKLAVSEIKKAMDGKLSQKQFDDTKTLMRGERARNYQRASNLTSYYERYFNDDTYEKFGYFDELMQDIKKQEAVEQFGRLFAEKINGFSFVGAVDSKLATELQAIMEPLWR